MIGTQQKALSRYAGRVLFVKAQPRPISFAQRRSILQALEQYGRIETFHTRPGSYYEFLAVTEEATTAQDLLDRNPVKYSLSVPRVPLDWSLNAFERLDNIERALRHPTIKAGTGQLPENGITAKSSDITLFIEQGDVKDLANSLNRSPLASAWPVSDARALPMSSILQQALPETDIARDLAHWLEDFGDKDLTRAYSSRIQAKDIRPSHMTRKSYRSESDEKAP